MRTATRILAKAVLYRGDDLVRNIFRLIDENQPLQVSLVTPVLSWSNGKNTGMAQVIVKHLELDRVP